MPALPDYRAIALRERDDRLRIDAIAAPPAEQVARENKVSRTSGVEPAMIGDLSSAERAQQADRFTQVLGKYPAFRDWAAENPRAAVVAQDDHKSLGLIGDAFEGLRNIRQRLLSGTMESAAGLIESGDVGQLGMLDRVFDNNPIKRARQVAAGVVRDEAAVQREKGRADSWLADTALSGLESLPLTVAAALTRNPTMAAAIPALSVRGNALAKGREQGLSEEKAQAYSLLQGGTEYLSEKFAATGLVNALFNKTPIGKSIVRQLATELPGEQIATFVQDLTDWAMLPENSEKTVGDFWAARPLAIAETLVASTTGTVAQTSVAVAADRTFRVAGKLADRVGQAKDARQAATQLDRLEKGVASSKAKVRDPEAIRSALDAISNDNDDAKYIHIPGEAAKAYMQSDSFDPDNDPFWAWEEQVNEAVATGGDVVIPIADALTDLAGTPAWAALKDDMRLQAGGVSKREADDFDGEMEQVMADMTDEMAAAEKDDLAGRDVRTKLVDRLASKFSDGGVPLAEARSVAELLAQRAATRTAAFGGELTGEEYGTGLEVRQVLPESAKPFVKREGAKITVAPELIKEIKSAPKRGPSLIEFIAKRGGINDPNGDLKSIGLDRWHLLDKPIPGKVKKNKAGKDYVGRAQYTVPFRKAVIRPVDQAAQENMLGGVDAQGEAFGLDDTLAAAISEGYFPELAGADQDNYDQLPDVQILLDALRDELHGQGGRFKGDGLTENEAANAARAALEQAGYNPAKMSEADIHDALAQMFEQDERGGLTQLPDTLNIDGVQRSTRNSEGQPLAGTEEGVRAFWKWFGKSEITDDQGRPLVMRHVGRPGIEAFRGSPMSSGLIYFNPNEAKARDAARYKDAAYSVYLRAEVPFGQKSRPTNWGEAEAKSERIQTDGYDSVYVKDEGGVSVAVFKPEQIKSINNRGTFDPADARILYQDLFDAENATDPAEREKARERLRLRAQMPLTGRIRKGVEEGKAQADVMPEGLFGGPITRTLFQEYGKDARGRIIFDQGKAIIELFQTRNKSTLLHELSHLWLEELRFDAARDDAPDQLKADWQTVQDWFAANGNPLDANGNIPVEAHELWARSGERYLMEGKAPSVGLRKLFETFRGWLTGIYKTVDALRAPISPEVREVFDRLLATDEEIQAANERQNLADLFKSAADAAMSAQEFTAYQAQTAAARAEAQGKLLDKTMASVRRKATKAYNDERATVMEEVTADVDAVPMFRAIRAMKTDRISEEWVKAEGIDIAALPKRVPPLTKPGGADPELIAELAGFATAGDMLAAIIAAESAHRAAKEGGDPRSMRVRVIEVATDAEMTRRHGDDPLQDGSIEREALEAVHNDMQGEVIATELRVLSRRTGKKPPPYALAKEWAANRVRSGKVQDEASPAAIQRYARAASKAGKAAEAAMLKQDADETFRQKQFQMLNNALVSEAKQAADEVNAAVKRMDRIARVKTMKSVDQDYLEQAQALLEEVDFRRRSQVSLGRKDSFEKWAQAKYDATGEEVYIPPRFDYQGTNWTKLPVETLLGLDSTIKSIIHIGRHKNELKLGKEKRDYNEARGEWLRAAEPLAERPAGEGRNPQPSAARGLFASLTRIDMHAKQMDNGDPNGLMTRVLFYDGNEADNTYARIKKDVLEPLIDAYMGMKGNRLHARVSAPEWIDWRTGEPSTFLRADLMAIALNLGNESNLRKMIAGEALLFKGQEQNAPTMEGIEQLLARELNEAEWNMVILAWRRFDSMFPEIAATERERTGITPEKVDPRMVKTPLGEVEGGYWPAVYDGDPAKVAAAGTNLAEYKENDLDAILHLTGRGVATNKGHTISRTDFVAPMYLNFEGVLFGHVNQVAKRIAYQAWGTQALKIIRDPKIAAMWARKLGPEYHDQLEPWLQDKINQGVVANTAHLAFINNILKSARMNLTTMGLVMRATTLLVQAGGLTNSAKAIGLSNLRNGFAIALRDYGGTKARIYESSPVMARRIDEFDRDQLAALAEMSRPRTAAVARALKPFADKRDKWNAFGFHLIGAVQLHLVDIPTWAGAYAQATGSSEEGGMGMDHESAAARATLIVEQAQGSGRASQLAAVQRGGEPLRVTTLFYTFFGTTLNYQWEMTQDVRNKRYGKAINSAYWIMIAGPLLAGLLTDAIRGELPDEDDEDDTWLAWAMRKIFFGMFSGIPIVRDYANQKERELGGKYAPDPVAPWTRVIDGIAGGGKDAFAGVSQTEWYQDLEGLAPWLPDPEEVSDKWIKHTVEAIGYLTRTGTGQVATTSQFIADVQAGDAEPEGFADWLEGLTTGKIKDD